MRFTSRSLAVLLLPVVLLCAVPLYPATSPTPTPTATQMAQRVDAHYNHLHSLRVQFTETYQGMGMKRTETGTLLLAKPGRMKWSYTEPAGKLFLIDGRYGYSYTPGDAQAERYPAKQLEDFRSPLRFLLGHARIEKELTGLTLAADAQNYRLRGVPAGMEQRVSDVSLTVTPEGKILDIEWKEADGATTEFRLTDEQGNPAISADTFVFQPPPGVAVVRGLAPI